MRGMARGYAAGDSRGPGWREFAGTLGQLQAGPQAGNGMACSRAKARLNWVSQGRIPGGNAEEMPLDGSVLSTVKIGEPILTVDRTIFEMWLGALSGPPRPSPAIVVG